MITILTGRVGSGKTACLKAAIPLLKDRGLRVDGYLSERVMDGENVLGYDLLVLQTGERVRLLRCLAQPGGESVGRFTLDPEGFAAAAEVIVRSRPSDLLILDELGRLELAGRGVRPAVDLLLKDARRNVLAVIREDLLEAYLSLFRAAGGPVSVFRLPASNGAEALVRAVAGDPA